jgi:hypothetical protein
VLNGPHGIRVFCRLTIVLGDDEYVPARHMSQS